MKYRMIPIYFVLILPISTHAMTGFLEIQPITQYIGRGGAASAIVNGQAAMFYNPAGLANTHNFGITINQINWFSDSDIYYLAVAKNLSNYGNVGIAFFMFNLDEQNKINLGTYQPYIAYFSLGYGFSINRNISVGISSKILTSKMYFYGIGVGSGNGYSVDLGLQVKNILTTLTVDIDFPNLPFSSMSPKTRTKGLSFGASINNLGPEFIYTIDAYTEEEKLLKTIRVGAGYNIIQSNLLSLQLSYDYLKEIKNADHSNSYNYQMFGGEITILNIISLQKGKQVIKGLRNYDYSMFGISIGTECLQFNFSIFDRHFKDTRKNFGFTVLF